LSKMQELRKGRNWSLTKMCVKTGIDPANLSRIERGQIVAYPGWRKRIAAAFELPEGEIFPLMHTLESREERLFEEER